MKGNKFKDEVELASFVIKWLEANDWEVFKEVKDIDIVALKGNIIWGIECKMRYSTEVCLQAYRNRHYFHYFSVAVPDYAKSNPVNNFFLRHHNIGLIAAKSYYLNCMYPSSIDNSKICEDSIEPKLYRTSNREEKRRLIKYTHYFKEQIDIAHKDCIAGMPFGSQMTSFKVTMERVFRFLKQNGPSTIDQIVDNVKWHYSNKTGAKQGILRAFYSFDGYMDKVENYKENKKTYWKLK
jgi:hypothetical protein